MKKTFTLLIALLALTVSSWAQAPTVITWDASDLATVSVNMGYDSPGQSQTIKDITVTNNAVYTASQNCDFKYDANYGYCGFSMRNGGSLTFAPESGTLTSIVITMSYDYVGTLPIEEGSAWEVDGENAKLLKWTGNAASVILQADGSSNYLASGPISSIAFTIEGFLPAVKWIGDDLESVNVGMENGAIIENANSSQEVNGITITANAPTPENEGYNSSNFSTSDGYTNLSVFAEGSLTFAPASGKLKKIVITCGQASDVNNINDGDGWSWNGADKLTWEGDAASVVLTPKDPSYGCGFMNISSVVFTVTSEDPTPSTPTITNITWNETTINGISLDCQNQDETKSTAEIDGIKASLTRTSAGDSYSHCQFDGTELWINGCGELKFESSVGNITGIVITCDEYQNVWSSDAQPSADWTYDPTAKTFTWAGTPSDEVTISGNIDFMISSIEFTVTSGGASVDPTPSGASIIWEQRQVSHVDFTYNATSPVIKNIILSLTETSNSGYYSFSDSRLLIQNNADLKFKSIVGNLTGIVITCSSADHHADLPTSWEYDAVAQTFTWAGDEEEVTLTGDIYATITSIEFTYTPVEAPRLGQAFWDGRGQKYVITGLHTAKMPQQTIYGTLEIPAFVEDGGVTYYVTEIADNAFKDNNELSNAYIGKNIARIGANAFEGCYHMYEAQTNSYVVDEIGDEAFKDCKLMYAFSCYTYTPPVLGTDAFSGDGLLNHINVYYDALPAYQIATNWSSYNSKISVLGSDAAVGDRFFYLDQMTQNIYAVTSTSPKEAKVMPYTSDIKAIYPVSREGSLIIPEKAYYMGSEYAITGIGANAYNGETGITMVIMPQNVKTIEAGAFLGCTNVEKVYFLWDDLSGITWADGAEGEGNEFDADTKIFVPKGMLATYQAWAPAWASRMVGGDVLDVEATAPDQEDTDHFGQFYRTFYDSSSDYMMPAGVWAYAGYVQNGSFILRPIAFDGQTLPRRTAVVLGSQTAEYRLIPMGDDAPLYTGQNELRGTDENLAVSSLGADADKVYVLNKEATLGGNRQVGMGMYKYTGTTLGAHKAYLIYDAPAGSNSAPARFVFKHEQNTTDIENVQSDKVQCTKVIRDGQLIIIKDGKEYNAQGQKLR